MDHLLGLVSQMRWYNLAYTKIVTAEAVALAQPTEVGLYWIGLKLLLSSQAVQNNRLCMYVCTCMYVCGKSEFRNERILDEIILS